MKNICVTGIVASLCTSSVQGFVGNSPLQLRAVSKRSNNVLNMQLSRGLADLRSGYLVNGEDKISYMESSGKIEPSVMYLPPLDNSVNDLKANIIRSYCQRSDHKYFSADWYGVGKSSGDILKGTVTRWTDDTIKVIETLSPNKKVCLVGGGLGGWVAVLIALIRPDLVGGIVGLSADPDFTENLLWRDLPDEIKDEIMEKGSCTITWGRNEYPISRVLIEDGRKNLVLEGPDGGLKIDVPMRLVHGFDDEEVPLSVPLSLMRRVSSKNVQVIVLKNGSHELLERDDMPVIKNALKDCLENYYVPELASTMSG